MFIFWYNCAVAYSFLSFLSLFCLSDLLALFFTRVDRQRREEEQKYRSSKKAADAEQSILNRVWFILPFFFLNLCWISCEIPLSRFLDFVSVAYTVFSLLFSGNQSSNRWTRIWRKLEINERQIQSTR